MKQWANSAQARGLPAGLSKRAARSAPDAPLKETREVVAGMNLIRVKARTGKEMLPASWHRANHTRKARFSEVDCDVAETR
ncbi:MAG: hypothetical protein Rhims3KO_26080 [Hyphomicrobiales bacterium]